MMKFLILLLFSVTAFASPKYAKLTQIAPINLTSAGTAQALSATDVLCRCAWINALAANTGAIYLGDSGVTAANGLVLNKGDSAIICGEQAVPVNLKNLYIDGGTTNDDVKVSCVSNANIITVPKGS